MGGSFSKTTEQIVFGLSRSNVQSLASDLTKKAFSEDRTMLILSPQHIVGTACILMYMYSLNQRAIGGWKEGDWIRATTSSATLFSQVVALFSKRNGIQPDADSFTGRVKQALTDPDTHSMHAPIAYGVPAVVVNGINDVYKGYNGVKAIQDGAGGSKKEDSLRLLGGTLALISQTMLWHSLFGRKEGVGRTAKLNQTGKDSNFFQFMLHDVEGLTARILPMTTRTINLAEGFLKSRAGYESGKNFKIGALVDLVSYFVSMGYQYQQLWNAHKQTDPDAKPDQNRPQEKVEKNPAARYTSSAKTR